MIEEKMLIVDKTVNPAHYYVTFKSKSKKLIDLLTRYIQKSVFLINDISDFSLVDFLLEYKSVKLSYNYMNKHNNLNKKSQVSFIINNDDIKLFFASGRHNDWCMYLSINEKVIIPVSEELIFKLFDNYIQILNFSGTELRNSIYHNVYQPQLRSRGEIDLSILDGIKKAGEKYENPGIVNFLFTLIYYLMIREENEDSSKNPFKSQLIMLLTHNILNNYSDDMDIRGICHSLCNRASSGDEEEYRKISNECSDANIEYRQDEPYVYIRKKVPVNDYTEKFSVVYILYEDEAIPFIERTLIDIPVEFPKIDISKVNINPNNVNVSNIITNNEDIKELAKEFNAGNRSINFPFVKELKEEKTTPYKFKEYEEKPELNLNEDSIVTFTNNTKIFFGQGKKDKWAALIAYRDDVYAVSDRFYFKFIVHAARKYGSEKLLALFTGIYNLMMRNQGLYRGAIDIAIIDYINYTIKRDFNDNFLPMKFFATEIYYCMIAEEYYKNEDKGITESICGCLVKIVAILKLIGGERIVDDNEIPAICEEFCSRDGKCTAKEILQLGFDNHMNGIIKDENGKIKRDVVALSECLINKPPK